MGRDLSGPPEERAWARALRWLAARDVSCQEMARRLEAVGFAAEVPAVLTRLTTAGYLDDARLAVDRAERLRQRGQGSRRIRADLERAGVEGAVIEIAVREDPREETERARRVLQARWVAGPDSPRERARAARFLVARGFPEEVVLAILGEGC